MDEVSPPLIKPSASDAATRSLVEDIKHLAGDGRTLLEAEFAYQKSRAAVAGAGAKGIAGWASLAIALVFFALMALVMGVLLGLAEMIGVWAATAVTVLAVLAVAGLCGFAARRRWKRMSGALADDSRTEDSP
ncbi:MAG: phage holin family protein [Pseudomonadota bacterium]|nr:phage holin family protein [Pseudomonadota bacterium]